MRFFRGISVPTNDLFETIDTIKSNGLLNINPKASYGAKNQFIRNGETLRFKSNLSLSDTRDKKKLSDAIYTCGDKEGAYYYANFHNRTVENDTPIIIEFEAPPSSIIVDGRDFLYPIFQMGDPSKARLVLKDCFGKSVLKYAELAWSSEDQLYRIAQCDLAINDRDVIVSHYKNKKILGGRHNTKFKCAFTVSLPIKKTDIISVQKCMDIYHENELYPDVNFRDLLVNK